MIQWYKLRRTDLSICCLRACDNPGSETGWTRDVVFVDGLMYFKIVGDDV